MRISNDHIWSEVKSESGNIAYKLTIHDLEDSAGNEVYRFYVTNDETPTTELTKDIPAQESDPKSFLFDGIYDKVFIWGKQVNDFHTLDYTKINMLAIPAIQELDKQLTAEKAKNATLEDMILVLNERVTAIESKI
jgi:hypothetical protein